jgi:hypothetical protein
VQVRIMTESPSKDPVPASAPAAPVPRRRLATGWRVALFLWATSFGFLFLYEVLTSILRLVSNLFSGGPPPAP